jgi:hypothetical protein
MAGPLFKLETSDGERGEPPTLTSAVPKLEGRRHGHARSWSDATASAALRDDEADGPPVLVVEEAAELVGSLAAETMKEGAAAPSFAK